MNPLPPALQAPGLELTGAVGQLLADAVCTIMGPARLAVVGDDPLQLMPCLLQRGVDACVAGVETGAAWLAAHHPGVTRFPNLELAMQGSSALRACLVHVAGPKGQSAFWSGQLPELVLAVIRTTAPANVWEQWIQRGAQSGWGQHPRQLLASRSGDALDAFGYRLLALSRGSAAVLNPEQSAAAEWAELAGRLVRPGDRALVLQRPESPTASIIEQCTRAARVDVEDPSAFGVHEPFEAPGGQQPVDFILAEQQSVLTLRQVARLARHCLRRTGRLAIAIGAAAADPGFLQRTRDALNEAGLIPERAWWQGAFAGSSIAEFDLTDSTVEVPSGSTALCVVAYCPSGLPLHVRPADKLPNITAFDRDYDDPAIVRSIIAIGLRIEHPDVRRCLARQAFDQASPTSADAGAALCVLCYDWFERGETAEAEKLLGQVSDYLQQEAVNPTALRWQVSLAYVAATMYQQLGLRSLSKAMFAHVLALDVRRYSPLLGTKTVAAALALGWMCHAEGDSESAHVFWIRALEEARRMAAFPDWSEVIGSLEAPETFGMPELAALIDDAGRAAAALRVTGEPGRSAAKGWSLANVSMAQRSRRSELESAAARHWATQLQIGKDWLDAQYHELFGQLSCAQAELERAADDIHRGRESYAGVVAAYTIAHREHERLIEIKDEEQQAQHRQWSQRVNAIEASYEGLRAAYVLASRNHAADRAEFENDRARYAADLELSERVRVEADAALAEMSRTGMRELAELRAAVTGLAKLLPESSDAPAAQEDPMRIVERISSGMDAPPARWVMKSTIALAERRIRRDKRGH